MHCPTSIVVPVATVVVLPVMLAWLYFRSVINRDNRKSEIIIKAIESNSNIDSKAIIRAFAKNRTAAYILQRRLLRGCIFTFVGLAFALYASIANGDTEIETLLACLSIAIGAAYLLVYFLTRHSSDLY